jgi:hypothetical protein
MRVLLLALAGLMAVEAPAADLSGVWWIRDRSGLAAVDHKKLPLRADVEASWRSHSFAAKRAKEAQDGAHRCLPEGLPRLMLAPYPIQILQRPEQITILHERMHMVRFLYLDREMRKDAEPTFNGESIAHWEGDTLVVETAALRPETVIDGSGIPHSDELRVHERFSLRDGGQTLRDEITIDDPATFSRRWSFPIDFDRRPGIRLMEDVCTFGPPQRDRSPP